MHRRANLGRSGLKVDAHGTGALLAYGDATVRLVLRARSTADVNGEPYPIKFATLAITVDDPDGFVRTVNDRMPKLTSPAG